MDTHTMLQQLAPALRDLFVTVLVPYAMYVIRTRVKNRELRDALELLTANTALCVDNAEQRVVRDAKDPSKPGQWTEELAHETKTMVMGDIKNISRAAIDMLVSSGHMDTGQIDARIERLIEQRKLELAHRSGAASAPTAASIPPPAPVQPPLQQAA